jgi:hypothetical protein
VTTSSLPKNSPAKRRRELNTCPPSRAAFIIDEVPTIQGEPQTTVCHLPPGTSKWNKIEHRLFSHISMNWRGRPLISHHVIVNTIAATTTNTGLRVHAELDTTRYPTGIKIPDQQMTDLETSGALTRHEWHPEWNHTLTPTARVEN